MTSIPDDPIVSRMERTGYAHDYEPIEDSYWESPDGETISREEFAEEVKRMAMDDPHWVADCLGFVWKEGRR